MSPLIRGLLRPALSTTVVGAIATMALLSGPSSEVSSTPVRPSQAHAATPAVSLAAAVVTTHRRHHRHHRHHSVPMTALRGLRVLHVAERQIGDRYAYGAAGPGSFDCSGLTAYAYRVATGKHLPHNAAAQQGRTHRISARSARPGDLVFFHGSGGVYHVAIYAGRHTVVHAPYPGQHVKRERIWTSAVTYGRVI